MQEDSATKIYIDEWGIISAEHHTSWFAISPSTLQIMQNKSKLEQTVLCFQQIMKNMKYHAHIVPALNPSTDFNKACATFYCAIPTLLLILSHTTQYT